MFANLRISQPCVLELAEAGIYLRFTEGSVVLKQCLLIFPPLSRRAVSIDHFGWAVGSQIAPKWDVVSLCRNDRNRVHLRNRYAAHQTLIAASLRPTPCKVAQGFGTRCHGPGPVSVAR